MTCHTCERDTALWFSLQLQGLQQYQAYSPQAPLPRPLQPYAVFLTRTALHISSD